jgi:hypothetical protein
VIEGPCRHGGGRAPAKALPERIVVEALSEAEILPFDLA